MNYLSSMETAKAMGITVRRVQQMCKQGEISGAVKEGHSWLIPKNAVWPDSGKKKKPMPIGISDFKTATSGSIFSAWIRALSAVAGFRNGCLDGLRELVGLRCVFGRHLHGVFEQVDGNIFYTVEPGYDFLNSGLTCSTAHAGDVEVHAALSIPPGEYAGNGETQRN